MNATEFVDAAIACFTGSPAEEYLSSRGTYDTTTLGWVGFETSKWAELCNRVIMPVYHPYQGELCAITGRTIDEGFDGKKYWNTSGMRKTRILYGQPRTEFADRPVALVEGQLDVHALSALGIPAYGTFGYSRLTGWQVGLLRRTTNRVIIWPDRETYDDLDPWRAPLRAAGIDVIVGPYPNDPNADDPDKICQLHTDDIQDFYRGLYEGVHPPTS